jgi:recombination protein RecA
VRIDVRRLGTIKEGETAIGTNVRAKVVKNKVAPPFRQAEFDILFECGVSWESSLIDMGLLCGVVEKAGAWFSHKGNRLGQGREAARKFLVENKDIAKEIEVVVRANAASILAGTGPVAAPTPAPAEVET